MDVAPAHLGELFAVVADRPVERAFSLVGGPVRLLALLGAVVGTLALGAQLVGGCCTHYAGRSLQKGICERQ